jgi:CHAT domain-containing protein
LTNCGDFWVISPGLIFELIRYTISHFSSLATDACSLSLQAGEGVDQAVEQLELGRGMILGYLIDSRSDLSQLAAAWPEHAYQYDRLRLEINAPISSGGSEDIHSRLLRRRRKAFAQLEDCLRSIRQLLGFDRFLLGPTSNDLKRCATEGPIVVVNVTDIRSDAIIVSTSDIIAVSLPEMPAPKVKQWTQQNLPSIGRTKKEGDQKSKIEEGDGQRSKTRDEDNDQNKAEEEYNWKSKRYAEFLSWLWSKCVKLILAELKFDKPASAELPRIWWIGTGQASSLPFHAAGDHCDGSLENALSKVVSSYTPTIKSLAYARECASRNAQVSADKPSVLVVAMPETPGQDPLDGVLDEISTVQEVVKGIYSVQESTNSVDDVLNKMKESEIAHFACHGSADSIDPSESHLLLLNDSQSQLTVDKLTVRRISEVNLGRAWIAYLSACSTVEVKAENIADEVLHFVSGFQIAGFAHVIGSLWSSNDAICVRMAKLFYKYLIAKGGAKDRNRVVAEALHHAVVKVRSDFPQEPLLWALYIHSGAQFVSACVVSIRLIDMVELQL